MSGVLGLVSDLNTFLVVEYGFRCLIDCRQANLMLIAGVGL